MHLKNALLFNYVLFTFNTGITAKSYNHSGGTKFMHTKTKYLQINQIVWKIIKLINAIYEGKVEVNNPQ